MKIMNLSIHAWTVCGLLMVLFFSCSNSSLYGEEFDLRNEPSVTYKYDRIDEVKKACGFVLSSASELKPDDNRVYSIKKELPFVNGDWVQDAGGLPLMPYVVRKSWDNSSDFHTPMNLVSFWVTHVDTTRRLKNSVSVSGLLTLGITLENSFVEKIYGPQFQVWPGNSQLSVSFQGIYTESKENNGEKVMCLLGTTMLPSREPESSDPWAWLEASGHSYDQLPLSEDDQILLVLHYPKKFTLTKREVHGEMKSLNPKSNPKYFDEIRISSQLNTAYEFSSEKVVAKACDPYPYKDSFMNNGIEIYKDTEFCAIIQKFSQGEAFTIVPNWRCNGTDEYCSKLGPFVTDKEIKATDGGFQEVKLFMQNVHCEEKTAHDNTNSARVSAVFRAVPPSEYPYTAALRSGLSNMTLPAEGIWRSSSGQLCMVGCIGSTDAEGSGCNSRICLYIPVSFSVKQRSIIVGTISSISNDHSSYFPLSFEKLVQPSEMWDLNHFMSSHLHYQYTKLDSAGSILEKNEPFSFGTVIKKSLLTFPKLEDAEASPVSLSILSEDLTLHVSAIPDPPPRSPVPRIEIQMEIVSLGPLFGRYWSNGSTVEEDTPYHTKAEYTEKQLLLNVSAQLMLTGKAYKNFSVVFVEGLYDPHVGKMYLVGCRDFRASWKTLFESMDLEAGLDCLIEVIVSYPPTTAQWLTNPIARISITSARNEDDPLHFSTIKFQTLPIMYRRQRENILSRRGVEGILRILTLSVVIACIVSQLLYIRDNVDSVPYISLVMLGVQVLGYSLPLITDAEALFKKASDSYGTPSYELDRNQWFHVIDYTVKLLVLVSFLLTLRLCQKVWKSRIRLLTRAPLEPHRVPSDKWVFITTLIIHVIGYIIVLIIHAAQTDEKFRTESYVDSNGNVHVQREWETELEEYVGLVQDFFLLPQVMGNFVWQIHCKPLRKLYFIGITVVRLLPHFYDYIRAPVSNPYFSEEYEFVNPNMDFYSKFGDIAIPVTAFFLAVIVYIQQRWNYEKLSQTLTLGKRRLLPLGSAVYQRLPSKSFEAELASGVNENATHEKDHDGEE